MNSPAQRNEFKDLHDLRDYYESIPEEKWTTGFYEDGGCYCALGHCGVWHTDHIWEVTVGEHSLIDLVSDLADTSITSVNDGEDKDYPQPTPKQRILAMMDDLIKLQQPTLSPPG